MKTHVHVVAVPTVCVEWYKATIYPPKQKLYSQSPSVPGCLLPQQCASEVLPCAEIRLELPRRPTRLRAPVDLVPGWCAWCCRDSPSPSSECRRTTGRPREAVWAAGGCVDVAAPVVVIAAVVVAAVVTLDATPLTDAAVVMAAPEEDAAAVLVAAAAVMMMTVVMVWVLVVAARQAVVVVHVVVVVPWTLTSLLTMGLVVTFRHHSWCPTFSLLLTLKKKIQISYT